MCGYAGFVSKHGALGERELAFLGELDRMLFHRGPDEGGVHRGPGYAVVHRRLSIIDVTHGQQPMLSADGRIGIAYNGEIYNFRDLRAGLEARGRVFATDCDTELFLALYEEEGVDCFARFDGMFTAFIWDFRRCDEGEFYLIRDQLGIKPLYVYEDATRFAFGSELTPLLSIPDVDLSIDPVGLSAYLTYRYVVAPGTFFRNIRRVEAGTYVKISLGLATTWRYWDLPLNENAIDMPEDEAAERLVSLLRASVAQQQMSDVPIGLLLSGGLDSSVIASLCADIGVSMTSFSIGFPDLNEFVYAEEVATRFGMPHIAVETTPSEIAKRFERVVAAMDEPIADPACFPLHILCESIKRKVTVVLSGEGSDEMFAGYPQHGYATHAKVADSTELFQRFMNLSWYFTGGKPLKVAVDPTRHARQKIYFDERSPLNGMLAFDQKTWLPENLMAKADKILMSHSLEGRFPFLSTALLEFASALPEAYKLGGEGGKTLLRRAFAPKLPASVIKRKKMGFSVPVADLLKTMKPRVYEMIASQAPGPLAEYIDFAALRRDADDHYSGRREQSLWLWTVLVLLQWQSTVLSSAAIFEREALPG